MDFAKTNRTGKNLRLFSCLLCCLILVLGSSFQSLAVISSSSNAFAVNPNYLIGSASNADPYGIATMELTDKDYDLDLYSSLGSVTNTIDAYSIQYYVYCYRYDTGHRIIQYFDAPLVDGKYQVSCSAPDNYYIGSLGFQLYKKDLPVPGPYSLSFDYSSDFSYENYVFELNAYKSYSNADYKFYKYDITDHVDHFSGEAFLGQYSFDLTSVNQLNIDFYISGSSVNILGGDMSIAFTRLDDSTNLPVIGPEVTTSEYQSDVSGSLSDISSSIGDMSESLDSAAENLEYISTSQNLIIQGIDNVIMHISDQLYAFWDQLYNLIHEPTYARLGDILNAIQNLDLEITVEMKEVTDAVNKMNQDMQNKLQNVQQTLTGGYDSSSMDSDNQELNSSLNEYEAAENELFDDAKENINSFEFDTDLGEFSAPLTDISYFLGSLFVGLGPMNVVISFSLTLTIAMVLIGWYRFKGGS